MEYLIHLAILFAIYAILAISLNVVIGYTGLLSVTHAAFYGIGAYAVAILLTRYDWNFFPAVVIGMVVSGVVALLLGLVMSRFKNDYYALASMGFNVIVYSVMLNWQDLTRGPLGIPGVSRPNLFGFEFVDNFNFLLLALVILLVVYGFFRFVVNSSFGRVLKAIRENEAVIRVFGYSTQHYKLVVFIMGAVAASVAGSLFAVYITFIDPSTFTLNESIFVLSIIILGGLASLRGSILGAAFLVLLPEALRFVGFPSDIAAQMRLVVYGLLLVLLMLYRPQGLVGEYKL
jgi:branched-chain amino acid transport system permease protein